MPKKSELDYSNIAVVVLRQEVLQQILAKQELKQNEQLNVLVQVSVHINVVSRKVELKSIEQIPDKVLKMKVRDFFTRQRLLETGTPPHAVPRMMNSMKFSEFNGKVMTVRELVEKMHERQRFYLERDGSIPYGCHIGVVEGHGIKATYSIIAAINAA